MSVEKKRTGFQTIEEVEACEKDLLVPEDLATLLQCDPYNINLTVKQDPRLLGFPVCMITNRVKIPRIGFINWYKWQVQAQ